MTTCGKRNMDQGNYTLTCGDMYTKDVQLQCPECRSFDKGVESKSREIMILKRLLNGWLDTYHDGHQPSGDLIDMTGYALS